MTTDLAEWASEHGQIIKSGLSDDYEGETIPWVLKFGYDRSVLGGYLGNVG